MQREARERRRHSVAERHENEPERKELEAVHQQQDEQEDEDGQGRRRGDARSTVGTQRRILSEIIASPCVRPSSNASAAPTDRVRSSADSSEKRTSS